MQTKQAVVPRWIREFSHAGWKNVFDLSPTTDTVYPITLRDDWKSQFNDWDGKILLLAKDGCPPEVITTRIAAGEKQPWRYGQRELGDCMGWRTNERLFSLASTIPGGKLYGSATANLLFDQPGASRKLKSFEVGQVQEYLQRVLSWVIQNMPRLEWVACLGQQSWFLTCNVLGSPRAANQYRVYRDSFQPIVERSGLKSIVAFPLYHPGALGNAINSMEEGWTKFAELVASSNEVCNGQNETNLKKIQTTSPNRSVANKQRGTDSKLESRYVVTPYGEKKLCRIQFWLRGKVVHTSPQYNTANTWEKIIAYARSKRGGAPPKLPIGCVAIPQVLTNGGWKEVNG